MCYQHCYSPRIIPYTLKKTIPSQPKLRQEGSMGVHLFFFVCVWEMAGVSMCPGDMVGVSTSLHGKSVRSVCLSRGHSKGGVHQSIWVMWKTCCVPLPTCSLAVPPYQEPNKLSFAQQSHVPYVSIIPLQLSSVEETSRGTAFYVCPSPRLFQVPLMQGTLFEGTEATHMYP